MKIVVIVPTYNEREAIGGVLEELEAAFAQAPQFEWHALVVDGNSPDSTADVVRDFASRLPNIHLLEESAKRGLASAYITGINHAIQNLRADAFVEFDGDGQHDPSHLALMAQALQSGADYVVGSRYIPGGSVPREWNAYRKLLSRFGSLYSRLLLEIPVHDATSGFKMTRASFADRLPLSPELLLTRDYAYKIQLLHEMAKQGAKIREVPIVFRHRGKGVSKSTPRDIVESLKVTAILRMRDWKRWRLLRVLAIGGVGFLLQAAVFEILGIRLKALSPSTATLAGAEAAILSNFFFNNIFAFGDRASRASPLFSRLVRFHVISAGSVLLQWVLVFGAEHITANAFLLRAAFIAGVGIGFIFNYFGYYFWVWKEKAGR